LAAVTQDFNLTLETDADCIFLVCVCVVSLITMAVMLFVALRRNTSYSVRYCLICIITKHGN